ncbi:hypothetical protein SCOCK_860006 [Actinacidiphila cocklensis]|uniref:Uncharacterized protein n=1 Tax=Actinacidiphila cocklensis TaxID=887465 RepID=A0A9W4EBR8_9ACTN|nr:hypothetical protein SCOCK_860006 [Actinacidiphila cocklensis]
MPVPADGPAPGPAPVPVLWPGFPEVLAVPPGPGGPLPPDPAVPQVGGPVVGGPDCGPGLVGGREVTVTGAVVSEVVGGVAAGGVRPGHEVLTRRTRSASTVVVRCICVPSSRARPAPMQVSVQAMTTNRESRNPPMPIFPPEAKGPLV